MPASRRPGAWRGRWRNGDGCGTSRATDGRRGSRSTEFGGGVGCERGRRQECSRRSGRRTRRRIRRNVRPHSLRRHRLLGRFRRYRRAWSGVVHVQNARKPHWLEGACLGYGSGDTRRRRRDRSHDEEELARPFAGAAVLRAEGRSGPLRQHSQLPEVDKKVRAILELDELDGLRPRLWTRRSSGRRRQSPRKVPRLGVATGCDDSGGWGTASRLASSHRRTG